MKFKLIAALGITTGLMIACSSNPPPATTLEIQGNIVDYTENATLQISSVATQGTINPNGAFTAIISTPDPSNLIDGKNFGSNSECTVTQNQNQPGDFSYFFLNLNVKKAAQAYGRLAASSYTDRITRVGGQFIGIGFFSKSVQLSTMYKCNQRYSDGTNYTAEYRFKVTTQPGWNIFLMTYKTLSAGGLVVMSEASLVGSVPPNIKWFLDKNATGAAGSSATHSSAIHSSLPQPSAP